MYYNARDFDYNVEDLINDYLIYGKDNKKTEYKIGRGWPDYKDLEIDVNMQEANEKKDISEMNNSSNIAPKMPEPMPFYPIDEREQSDLKIFKPSCPNCGPGPVLPPPPRPRPPIIPQPIPTPPPRPMPPMPPGNGLCPCPQPMPQPVPRPPISPRPYGLMPDTPAGNTQPSQSMPYELTPNTPAGNTQPSQPMPYGLTPNTPAENVQQPPQSIPHGLMPNTPAGNVQPSQPIPEVLLPGIYQPNRAMPPTDEYSTIDDQDAKLMRLLYSEVNRKIHPHVERILDEFEYVGSPVYSEQIDRETIAQIVDRVINSARSDIDEIEELLLQNNEDVRHYWLSGRMLRAIVEALVLNDIFAIRRPRYRRIRRNYNYLNNYYNGLNYYY